MAKDAVADAVAAVYDAALQPDIWPLALSRLNDLVRSTWTVMAVLPTNNRGELVTQNPQASADHLDFFRLNYNSPSTNPAIPSLLKLRPGGIVLREQDMNDAEWHRCGLYREVYRPANIYHGVGACVMKAQTHVCFLGANRPKRWGPFGEDELKVLRHILPHVERALQVAVRLANLQTLKSAHERLWDALSYGAILLDEEGEVLWSNREAQSILSRADGLFIRNKFLCAANHEENAQLQRMVRASATARDGRAATADWALSISRPSLARPLALLIAPIRIEHPFVYRPVVTVLITDPERKSEAPPAIFTRLYGLTPREAALATLLLQGMDLREAAQQLDVSMNTARTHLRLIFEKTDTHRQSELLRLLLRSPAGLT